ncbi:MAG: ribosomal RNA small subunit methyltransferase A [Spirochaetes bacterium GWF1_41_5]|nr:MAG: ribosomal RNA small subunit methyltransferase A [Spirochaetes bacterium GWF1_41_5]
MPGRTKNVLVSSGKTVFKSLGQHYLHDQGILKKIASLTAGTCHNLISEKIMEQPSVIEIGSGIGNLTGYLLENGLSVTGIEKEKHSCEIASREIAGLRTGDCSCIFYHLDFLELSSDRFSRLDCNSKKLVVGNLPYNAASHIIIKCLEEFNDIAVMKFMVQKEMGERLATAPGSRVYGVISVLCGFFCSIKKEFNIPAACFIPRPKVESVFLTFTVKSENPPQDYPIFKNIVKCAFSQRRKKLVNALLSTGNEKMAAAAELLGWGSKRAEELSVADFINMTKAYRGIS